MAHDFLAMTFLVGLVCLRLPTAPMVLKPSRSVVAQAALTAVQRQHMFRLRRDKQLAGVPEFVLREAVLDHHRLVSAGIKTRDHAKQFCLDWMATHKAEEPQKKQSSDKSEEAATVSRLSERVSVLEAMLADQAERLKRLEQTTMGKSGVTDATTAKDPT
jgi:hypothetical protein